MEVLLINPPFKRVVLDEIASIMPPLGLGIIASVLEQSGIEVGILDAEGERIDFSELERRLEGLRLRFVGITATTTTFSRAIETAKICKKIYPEVTTVLGGPHPSLLPDEALLEPSVDLVIRGEGEFAFLDLVMGRESSSIEGLSYKDDNGKIIHNPQRTFLKNLDLLPTPAYNLFPIKVYRPGFGKYLRLPAMALLTSRGCPGKCTFCAAHIFGRAIRRHSPQRVVKEIEFLVKEMGVREIAFYDDTFTSNKKWVLEFCELVRKTSIELSFSISSRIDYVDEEVLSQLREVGCHTIGYGVESASDEILKNIKKKISLEEVREKVKMTQRIGIRDILYFMYGNPGETEETMQKTFNFAKELNPYHAYFNIATPYPNTEMYFWAKRNGYLKTTDWSQYTGSNCVMELPTISSEKIERFCYESRTYFIERLKSSKRL